MAVVESTGLLVPPTDEVLLPVVQQLRETYPSVGVRKLLALLKDGHPQWPVSEKRLRKLVQSIAPARVSVLSPSLPNTLDELGLPADTGIDPSVKVDTFTPKVKARMFGGEKGKGLVAREKIFQGEVLWQEEPWVVTADPELYPLLLGRRMCTYCFTMLNPQSPALSVSCAHCDMAYFCNRLCQSKANSSASHHDLLCPGQNEAALDILKHIHQQGSRHLDAVAKIIALWRGARDGGDSILASDIDRRIWGGMARISIEKKEMERREWEMVGEPRRTEWQNAHSLILKALNPSPGSASHEKFCKTLVKRHPHRAHSSPLTPKEEERWFSYESFLELLGLASLNQEGSGGLYLLHAHINHSCEPNLMARNLPKNFVSPPISALPCNPPPPNAPGVCGTNRLSMIARRTIHPGEELCLPYVNFNLPRLERRKTLRELYGFWCACPKCQMEKPAEEQTRTNSIGLAETATSS